MPSISVIIPTFNRATSLRQTLAALADQTLPPQSYEVIIVDDGSTDDTEIQVREFARQHPQLNVRYMRHGENRRKAAACNTGAREAGSDLLVFTDDDIRPSPGWLEAHLARHEREPRTVAVTGLVRYPEEWVHQSNWVRFADDNYQKITTVRRLKEGGLPPNRLTGGNTSLRRTTLEQVGFFNETLGRLEDIHLGCQLFEAGVPLLYEPSAVVYHYAETILSIDKTLTAFQRDHASYAPLIRKHYPWYCRTYGHWFLEPVDSRLDTPGQKAVKTIIRAVTGRMAFSLVLFFLKKWDGMPRMYWRSLYQYVMVCAALQRLP